MNYFQQTILAIAPGKREIGVAVFDGSDLIYASVKTLRNRASTPALLKEITSVLQKVFDGFPIRIVVIKEISPYQRLSADIEIITRHIKYELSKNGFEVAEITLDQIKSRAGKILEPAEQVAERLLRLSLFGCRGWRRVSKDSFRKRLILKINANSKKAFL
jgi:RNase H-fold protein (predicted Holliday junction resolvase)